MRIKLFVVLIFDKIQYILLFLILVTASGLLILKSFDSEPDLSENTKLPDVVIMGAGTDRDGNPVIYEGLPKLIDQLSKTADHNTKVHSIIARNLFTFTSPFYHVAFEAYGVDASFFDQFDERSIQGTLPCQGRKEVVAGYNAAVFYQLEVGDIISDGLAVNDEQEEYIVSGILGEEDRYFGNGFYLLKENFRNTGRMPENNMVMVYTSGKRSYKAITEMIHSFRSEYESGSYVDNYKQNQSEKNRPVRELVLNLAVSFLLLELVYFYISKGMDKKAGILKAMGIPDHRVLTVCAAGFGGLVILSCVCIFLSAIIIYHITFRLLVGLVAVIGLISYLILLLEVVALYKRISPKACMPAG